MRVQIQTFSKAGELNETKIIEVSVPNLRQLQAAIIFENRAAGLDNFVLSKERGRRLEEWTSDGKILLRTFARA